MSAGQTIRLHTDRARATARRMIDLAPPGSVVNIREATRTNDQNAKLWVLLSDVSRSKPQDRLHTPEVWKCLFMNACGHAVQFEHGLSGEPFPIGFRSSRLTKLQMSELIEFVLAWGTENQVHWSEPHQEEEAAA